MFKKICIIDDDEIFLLVSKSIIKSQSFSEEVMEYNSAVDALNYLKENMHSEDVPEVIILDINMPLMDGWEFMEAIEQLGIADKFKVFISSSSINPVDLEKAAENPHIASFIDKPITPEKLEMIRRQFNRV